MRVILWFAAFLIVLTTLGYIIDIFNDKQPSSDFEKTSEGIMLIIGVGGFYLLPTLVAAWRKHRQLLAIFLLNLLLGWTTIGWVAAIIWAVLKPPVVVTAST